jgi:uncharacterized membrane protein YeaQ/YmgE (transglycosylase-associated protein family)
VWLVTERASRNVFPIGEIRVQHFVHWERQMLALIGTLIVGLVVGLIARALKPGDDSMGIIMTMVVGIVGSLIAGYVGRALGWYQPGQAAGWIASVIGAIVLLVIVGFVKRRT